jgi:DNA (cytosine-5)-methyltransferase 1
MTSRPRLLDLFAGAGGAAVGYHRAGFDVVGVDLAPQPRYPFAFVQADALDYCREHGHEFDAIHASPPCQAYSALSVVNRKRASNHPRLIEPARRVLQDTGIPYVIENIVGAPLNTTIQLCGSSFGLRVRRHRRFESNVMLFAPHCRHSDQGRPVGVFGDHPESAPLKAHARGGGFNRADSIEDARDAMGIDWMEWSELTQAIPPAYTEWIGGFLLAWLREATPSPTV